MSYPINRYYNINRFFLSMIGMWPHQNEKTKLIITIYSQVAMFFLIGLMFIEIIKSDPINYNIDYIFKMISFILFYLCVVTHYYIDFIEIKMVNIIWNRIECDWNELIPTKGVYILEEYASTSKLYNIILIGLYYIAIIFALIQTMLPMALDVILPLNESRPFKSPIPMDLLVKQTKYFYPTIISVFILLAFFGIITTAVNGLFVVCVQHACAMFRFVRYTLDETFENIKQRQYMKEKNERIYQQIIHTIKAHKRALEFVEYINVIYQKVTLLQVFIGSFIIGIDVLQLLKVKSISNNMEDTLMSIFHLFGSCGWGLIANILCQSIIDHSLAIFDQVCVIPWYLIRPKTRRLLLLLMMNSLKPCYISVGNIFILSNEFCASYLQTVMSFTMIIYSLQ